MAAPTIGAGHGRLDEAVALSAMLEALSDYEAPMQNDSDDKIMQVPIVRWDRNKPARAD